MYIRFFKPNMEPDRQVSDERRLRLIRACLAHRNAFENHFNWCVPLTHMEIFTEGRWAASCGIPNGGGCYQAPNRIGVKATDQDDVPDLCHELYHQYLWFKNGNADPGHSANGWGHVESMGQQVCDALRRERSQNPARNP